MSVTHLAGPVVHFVRLDRLVQRCALCGEKLEDLVPSCISVQSSDGRNELPSFPERALVRVEGTNPKVYHVLGDWLDLELPDDFCLDLVER